MTSAMLLTPTMSANDRFKQNYERTLRWAVVAAFLLTAILWLTMPHYQPVPYSLPLQPHFEPFDYPPDIELPPPPPPLPKPKDVVAVPELDVPDPVLAATLVPIETILRPTTPTWLPEDQAEFVPSSTKPRILFQAPPEYPEIARLTRVEGVVVVNVLVGVDGLVREAVLVSGTNALLDRAALDAALRCQFEPGRQREIAVPVWIAIPYRFRLR